MPTSTIALSALTVTTGFGQTFLHWSITDPNTLTYRKLDAVEIWAATTNDRTVATKVREAKASDGIHSVSDGSARYYWIRARDLSGDYSDWSPTGSTAGVLAAANASISQNGYVKLPSGLMLQWGVESVIGGTLTITFPIPFPNRVFSIIPALSSGALSDRTLSVGLSSFPPSTTDFIACVRNGAGAGVTESIYWQAIGY
jgi:hypothetical protein